MHNLRKPKGHNRTTGRQRKVTLTLIKHDTYADLNTLKFVAEQMQQLNLSFEALKQSQDNLCQCLMNKQNVTESTIDSMTEHCSGDATAKPVLPVQKSP